MRLLLLLALGLAGYVSCDVEDTPNVLPVEALVAPIQQIAGEDELGARMGLTRDFSLQVEMEMPVPLGMTRRKLRLLYKGVPVRVFTFQATCDPNGYYTGAVSGFIPRIDGLDVSIERKEKELRQVVVDYVNTNNVRVNVGDIKVKDLSNLTCTKVIHVDTKTGRSSVCYFCQSVIDTVYNYPRRPMVLIDALTLKVLIGSVRCRFDTDSSEIDSASKSSSTNKMCPRVQGGNKRNPTPVYGPGKSQVCLNTAVKGNKCSLTNSKVTVKHCQNDYDLTKADVVTFNCDDGPNDAINGAFSPAADAFHYANLYNCFFRDRGLGLMVPSVTIYCHYGPAIDNAFFDGRNIVLGDGDGNVTSSFADPDIIAHEMTHRVTASLGILNFDQESLALDEAMSDIYAIAFRNYRSPALAKQSPYDWRFGAGVYREGKDGLRSFDNPSVRHVRDFDPLNPFNGNGIVCYIYYLLVSQHGMSHEDVFKAFNLAHFVYMQEETTFMYFGCGLVRAAIDLGYDKTYFISAVQAVGITLDRCSLTGSG